MGKFINDAVLDLPADDLIANGDKLVLCAGQPANYAEATTALGTGSGKKLAEIALDSGDYTKADGDASGRKVTIGAQTGTVSVSGDCDHVAIVDTGNGALKLVSTITSQTLTAGNTWNLGAFKLTLPDPG